MLQKLLDNLNPLKLLSKLLKPEQFDGIAAKLVGVAGNGLKVLGFSAAAVSAFEAANTPIVSGLMALGVGAVMSFVAAKKSAEKKE